MPRLITMGLRQGVQCECGLPIWQLRPGAYTCTSCKRTDDSSRLLEPAPLQAAKKKGARPTAKAATTRKRPARKATKRKPAAAARTRKEPKPA